MSPTATTTKALTDLFSNEFLSRLEALCIECKKPSLWGRPGGPHVVNRRGTSVEFADYSKYVPGDDIRYIDWNLYGRLEKLFVKTFKEDVELFFHVLVDGSASMGLPAADDKFGYARRLALALAYVGLSNRHVVRAAVFSGREDLARSRTRLLQRRDGIFHIKDFLDARTPAGAVDFPRLVERYVFEARGQSGAVVLLSDFLIPYDRICRGLNLFRFKNYDVKVIQVLGATERDPARWAHRGRLVDAETGRSKILSLSRDIRRKYQEALARHTERLRAFCRTNQMNFAQVTTDQALEAFVLKELPRLGFVR